eukprot:20759-Heterococcus_DN1.PRE.1
MLSLTLASSCVFYAAPCAHTPLRHSQQQGQWSGQQWSHDSSPEASSDGQYRSYDNGAVGESPPYGSTVNQNVILPTWTHAGLFPGMQPQHTPAPAPAAAFGGSGDAYMASGFPAHTGHGIGNSTAAHLQHSQQPHQSEQPRYGHYAGPAAPANSSRWHQQPAGSDYNPYMSNGSPAGGASPHQYPTVRSGSSRSRRNGRPRGPGRQARNAPRQAARDQSEAPGMFGNTCPMPPQQYYTQHAVVVGVDTDTCEELTTHDELAQQQQAPMSTAYNHQQQQQQHQYEQQQHQYHQ